MRYKNTCEMCLMPFKMDDWKRESEKYCSYCYKNWKICFDWNLGEFKEIVYKAMREKWIWKLKAKFFTWMINFAPYWKTKK